MRQPSLYEYFGSKHALYDAMFADGNRQAHRAPGRRQVAPGSPCRSEAVSCPRSPRSGSRTRPATSCCSKGTYPASPHRRSRMRWPRSAEPRRGAHAGRGRDSARRHRLHRRHDGRAHGGPAQQRPRRQPLGPSSQPTRRPLVDDAIQRSNAMKPDRINRPEARRLAEEEFRPLRRGDRLAHHRNGPSRPTAPPGMSARWPSTCSDRPTPRPRCASSPTSYAGGCRSTSRSTRTTGSTA